MVVQGNVIQIDRTTYLGMRQAKSIAKELKAQRNPIYENEINLENELYDIYMKQVLQRAA